MNEKSIEYRKKEAYVDQDDLCNMYLQLAQSRLKLLKYKDAQTSYQDALIVHKHCNGEYNMKTANIL